MASWRRLRRPKPKHNIEIGVDTTEVVATLQKIADVRTICAKYENPAIEVDGKKVDLVAHAVANDWSAEKVELHALRASSLSQPVPAARHQPRPRHEHERPRDRSGPVAGVTRQRRRVRRQALRRQDDRSGPEPHRFAAASRPISHLLHEAIRAAGKYVPAGLSGDALAAEYRDSRVGRQLDRVDPWHPVERGEQGRAAKLPGRSDDLGADRCDPFGQRLKTYTSYRLTAAGQFEKVGTARSRARRGHRGELDEQGRDLRSSIHVHPPGPAER